MKKYKIVMKNYWKISEYTVFTESKTHYQGVSLSKPDLPTQCNLQNLSVIYLVVIKK